jgi:hypothetical protein
MTLFCNKMFATPAEVAGVFALLTLNGDNNGLTENIRAHGAHEVSTTLACTFVKIQLCKRVAACGDSETQAIYRAISSRNILEFARLVNKYTRPLRSIDVLMRCTLRSASESVMVCTAFAAVMRARMNYV